MLQFCLPLCVLQGVKAEGIKYQVILAADGFVAGRYKGTGGMILITTTQPGECNLFNALANSVVKCKFKVHPSRAPTTLLVEW